MKLIILDYSSGDINIIKGIPENFNNIEDFINNKWKDDEISWMLTEDDCRYLTWTYDKKSNTAKYDNENFINNG